MPMGALKGGQQGPRGGFNKVVKKVLIRRPLELGALSSLELLRKPKAMLPRLPGPAVGPKGPKIGKKNRKSAKNTQGPKSGALSSLELLRKPKAMLPLRDPNGGP